MTSCVVCCVFRPVNACLHIENDQKHWKMLKKVPFPYLVLLSLHWLLVPGDHGSNPGGVENFIQTVLDFKCVWRVTLSYGPTTGVNSGGRQRRGRPPRKKNRSKVAFLKPSFNLLKNPKSLFHRFLKQVVNLSCYNSKHLLKWQLIKIVSF